MPDATGALRARPPIAVIGLACRFPDADDPAALLDVVLTGRRSFRRLPPARLELDDYYQPDRSISDATYSTRAALIEGWQFERSAFGVDEAAYIAADPAHWLALETAARALAAAGLPAGTGLDRDRTGVIIGNTLTGDTSRANALRVRWPYVRRVLTDALGTDDIQANQARLVLSRAETGYLAPFAAMGPDSLAGSMPGAIAAGISTYFGFRGGSHAVDSACSSSLQAIASACAALSAGDLDAAIAGGVDLSIDPLELIGLAKSGLLASSDVRIYDAHPTGYLPGEGCGVVVLMRSADARTAGLPVHAEIVGWGTSGGGKPGEMQSHASSQLLAMQRAYERSGVDPADITYLEGNGAGTRLGDEAELAALASIRSGASQLAALGSVKANIGHAQAAAGAAGLIKTVLALGTGVVPPTTGSHAPHELIANGEARVAVPEVPRQWPVGPRLAAVSTMGIGGANVHVVLRHEPGGRARQERWLRTVPLLARAMVKPGLSEVQPRLLPAPEPMPFLLHAPDRFALTAVLSRIAEIGPWLSDAEMADLACMLGRDASAQGRTRVGIVAARQSQLAMLAREAVTMLPLLSDGLMAVRPGVFASDDADGRVTLLLSGQPEAGEKQDASQPDVVRSAVADCLNTLRWLESLGVHANASVGHGLGALAGLAWTGVLGEAEVVEIAELRAEFLARSANREASGSTDGDPQGAVAAQGELAGSPAQDPAAREQAAAASPSAGTRARQRVSMQRVNGSARAGNSSRPDNSAHPDNSPHPDSAALRAAIAQRFRFGPPRRRLISTLTGTEIGSVDEAIELICSGFDGGPKVAAAIVAGAIGATLLAETGPGRALVTTAADATQVPAISLEAGLQDAASTARVAAAIFAAGAMSEPQPLFTGRQTRLIDIWRERVFLTSPCNATAQPAADTATADTAAADTEPTATADTEPASAAPATAAKADTEPVDIAPADAAKADTEPGSTAPANTPPAAADADAAADRTTAEAAAAVAEPVAEAADLPGEADGAAAGATAAAVEVGPDAPASSEPVTDAPAAGRTSSGKPAIAASGATTSDSSVTAPDDGSADGGHRALAGEDTISSRREEFERRLPVHPLIAAATGASTPGVDKANAISANSGGSGRDSLDENPPDAELSENAQESDADHAAAAADAPGPDAAPVTEAAASSETSPEPADGMTSASEAAHAAPVSEFATAQEADAAHAAPVSEAATAQESDAAHATAQPEAPAAPESDSAHAAAEPEAASATPQSDAAPMVEAAPTVEAAAASKSSAEPGPAPVVETLTVPEPAVAAEVELAPDAAEAPDAALASEAAGAPEAVSVQDSELAQPEAVPAAETASLSEPAPTSQSDVLAPSERAETAEVLPAGAPATEDAEIAATVEPAGSAVARAGELENFGGLSTWTRCFTERLRPVARPAMPAEAQPWRMFAAARSTALADLSGLFTADPTACRTLAVVDDPADERSRATALEAAHDAMTTGELVVVTTSPGFTGFFASLHAEHPSIGVTILRVPPDAGAAPAAIQQFAAAEPGSFRELVLGDAETVSEPVLSEVPLAGGGDFPLGPNDVILISRGTCGAALALAQVLAICGTGIAVVGRPGEHDDDSLIAGLEVLRSAGARVGYEVIDIADPPSLTAAVRRIEDRLGAVTAVAHGAAAGDLVSMSEMKQAPMAEHLGDESALLDQLAGAVRPGQLKMIITFGSVIGRYGLAGASLQALSSGALTSRATQLADASIGCEALHVDLPAWDARGMGDRPGLAAELAAAGTAGLDVATASRLLLKVMTTPDAPRDLALHGRVSGLAAVPAPVLTAAELDAAGLAHGGRFLREIAVYYRGIELISSASLGLDTDPYLADYRIDGLPVLPPVLALEALAQAASVLARRPLRRAASIAFDSPVVIPPGGEAVLQILAHRDGDTIVTALRCSDSSYRVDHARAEFSCAAEQQDVTEVPSAVASAALNQFAASTSGLVDGAELYGPICFQSGRFRRIALLPEVTARSGRALARASDDRPWFAAGSDLAATTFLLGSPGLNDAAIQVLQACVPHRRVRAAGCESVQFSGRAAEGPVEIRAIAAPVQPGASGDGYTSLVPDQAGPPTAELTPQDAAQAADVPVTPGAATAQDGSASAAGSGAAGSGAAGRGAAGRGGAVRPAVVAVAPADMTPEERADMEVAERRPQSRKSRRASRRAGGHSHGQRNAISSALLAAQAIALGSGHDRATDLPGARDDQLHSGTAPGQTHQGANVPETGADGAALHAVSDLAGPTLQRWDIEAVDAAGQLLATWRGVHLHDSGPLPRNAAWPPTLLSVFLERSAVDLGLDDGLRVTVSCGQPDVPPLPLLRSVPQQASAAESHNTSRGRHAGPERRAVNTATAPGEGPLSGFGLTLRAPVPVACGWAVVDSGLRHHEPEPGLALACGQLRAELGEPPAVLAARLHAIVSCAEMADLLDGRLNSAQLSVTRSTSDGWALLTLGRASIACAVVELSGIAAPVAVALLTRRHAHARPRERRSRAETPVAG